eukprot:121351-Rhodomonas_salina.3
MAEAARTKLGQVGQVEAVRKELQFEIQQAREGEAAVKEEVEKLRKVARRARIWVEREAVWGRTVGSGLIWVGRQKWVGRQGQVGCG